MATFRVVFDEPNLKDEEVEADLVEEAGHEGQWVDFYATPFLGGRGLVLRIRAAKITRIQRL